MKSTSFSLQSDKGPISVSCNEFWVTYLHCIKVHPGEDHIRNTLEHVLQARISNELAPAVRRGCQEVVNFYKQHAKIGRVHHALTEFMVKHPDPQERIRIHDENHRKVNLLRQFYSAETKGPIQ